MAAKKRARRPRTKKGVDFDTVRKIALALPGVEEGTSYGTPAFRVKKKLFLRLREDGEDLVVRAEDDLREMLLETEAGSFHVTDHYRGHPYVLARLPVVAEARLTSVIEESWRSVAPARSLEAFEGEKKSEK